MTSSTRPSCSPSESRNGLPTTDERCRIGGASATGAFTPLIVQPGSLGAGVSRAGEDALERVAEGGAVEPRRRKAPRRLAPARDLKRGRGGDMRLARERARFFQLGARGLRAAR